VNPFTVIDDACVLYPAPLRDLLMHRATVLSIGDGDTLRSQATDRYGRQEAELSCQGRTLNTGSGKATVI